MPDERNIAHDSDILRRYILQCPSLDMNSETIRIVLESLEHMKLSEEHTTRAETSSSSDIRKTYANRRNHRKLSRVNTASRNITSSLIGLSRLLIIDLPLAALFASYLLVLLMHRVKDNFLMPQLQLMTWNDERRSQELTYYHRTCDKNDITALSAEDLLIGDDFTIDDCVRHHMIHGMSIYPNILTSNTSDVLRNYILKRNLELTHKDTINVLSNKNRWSFGLAVDDHPIVAVALAEISSHPVLRPALERIVGHNPAIIEFTAITSAFGAEDQIWHADVLSTGSAARYARSFIPSYSLFIPLQDVTSAMGATTVCPGTYMCDSHDPTFCEDYGFQASGNSVWWKGHGVFMNQQSFHRGAAHIDPNGPHRVLFILTFAHRPLHQEETRQIGQGGSYSMRWDMWGHCLNDLDDAESSLSPPWAPLRALGVYKPHTKQWGWDYVSMVSMRIANADTGYKYFDLERFARNFPLALPTFLIPPLSEGASWTSYLSDVLLHCEQFLLVSNIAVFFIYTLVVVSMGVIVANVYADLDKERKFGHPLRQLFAFVVKGLRRLIAIQSVIILLTYLSWKRISSSRWALDISRKRLYSSAFSSRYANKSLAERKTVYVNRNDVLISTRGISRNYAAYSQQIDYHPGNLFLEDALSEYSGNFSTLSCHMQRHLLHYLFIKVCKARMRFLIQTSTSDWVEATTDDMKWYITRQLITKAQYLFKEIDQEADFLLADVSYGYLKSTSLARYNALAIYSILRKISICFDMTLLDLNKFYRTTSYDYKIGDHFREGFMKSVPINKSRISRIASLVKYDPVIVAKHRTFSLPSIDILLNIIHDKALYIEGDVVEARYRGNVNEWYRGRISRIAGGGLFEVIYDDGDKDVGLSISSVNRFDGYKLNEIIQARRTSNGHEWLFAIVTKVLENSTSVLVIDSDGEEKLLEPIDLRRVPLDFNVDDSVFCEYRVNPGRWFPATIVASNGDGTYDVLYADDGELEESVPSYHIIFSWAFSRLVPI